MRREEGGGRYSEWNRRCALRPAPGRTEDQEISPHRKGATQLPPQLQERRGGNTVAEIMVLALQIYHMQVILSKTFY